MGKGSDSDILDERAHFAAPGSGVRPAADDAEFEHAREPPSRSGTKGARLSQTGRRVAAYVAEDFSVELSRGAAFLFLPVFLGAGALVYFTLPFEPEASSLICGLAALLLAAVLARKRFFLRLFLLAGLTVLLGLGVGKIETWRAGANMLGSDVTTRVTGRVVGIEDQASGRERVTIDVGSTARPRLKYPPERIRATARHIPEELSPGDGVSGLVRLLTPSGPVRPQGYDFAFESYFDGLDAVGFFLGDPREVALPALPSLSGRLSIWLETTREHLARRIRSQVGGPEGAVAAALITGVRGGIPDDTEEALRAAGLAHILAISGLHMVLVTLTVMGIIRLGFGLFPGFSSRHPVRKYAAGTALAACAAYLIVSGAAVAAQRSFIMLGVMLVALIVDRSAITMRNLAVAALVVIAWSPHEVVGPSFQMSFAATAALIAGYATWTRARQKTNERRPPPANGSPVIGLFKTLSFYVGGLALTSLIAGAATTIFAIWHFQRAAPLGLIANLAAMPAVSLVVMPSAVLAAALMPFGLEWLPLSAMGKGLGFVIWVAGRAAEMTPFDATGLLPASAVVLAGASLVILTLTTTRLRLAAVPVLAAAFVAIAARQLPDLLISEDGRLAGLLLDNGSMAVNRTRPGSFVGENWLRALGAANYQKPASAVTLSDLRTMFAAGEKGFVCMKDLCMAAPRDRIEVAVADNWEAARSVCATASLIILKDATARDVCGHGGPVLVTTRELARRGSASVSFVDGEKKPVARVTYSIDMPWRPWHMQRAWSRAARGLPLYRRKKKAAPASEKSKDRPEPSGPKPD